MKKINNKSIVYSLGILAILTLGVIVIPTETRADTAGFVTPYNNTNFNNSVTSNNQYNNYVGPAYPAPIYYSATPTIYSNTANVSQAKSTTASKTVAKTKTTTSESNNSSNLAANAIFGSDSFMPSGIIQWILFAILVLLIVILTRKIFGADKDYQATPMKHD